MYRVTAEAVSGTKVFAGGKWLKCIGNKPVHVGERVWTDGRCVYGNYQESQQPPVIIPQAPEEIIPLFFSSKEYYEFTNNKLKQITFNDREPPETIADKYYFYLMANNKKGFHYLYDISTLTRDNNTTINSSFYERIPIVAYCDNSNNFWSINEHYTRITSRVWGGGSTIAQAITEWQPDCYAELPYEVEPYDVDIFDKIEIQKNDDIIAEIDLKSFINETKADCPNTRPFVFYEFCNYWGGIGGAVDIIWGYIKNEKDWALILRCQYTKCIEWYDENRLTLTVIEAYKTQHGISDPGFVEVPFDMGETESNTLTRLYYIDSQGNEKIAADSTSKVKETDLPDSTFPADNPSNIITASDYRLAKTWQYSYLKDIKFPLDGKYFYKFVRYTHLYEEYDNLGRKIFGLLAKELVFFSQNEKEIFRGYFPCDARIAFCRISLSKYLLLVHYGDSFWTPQYVSSVKEKIGDDVPIFINGLYFFSKGQWELLKRGKFLNEYLLPIPKKKSKVWTFKYSIKQLQIKN